MAYFVFLPIQVVLCEANRLFNEGYYIEGRRNRRAKGRRPPPPPQCLQIHLTLFSLRWTDFAHHINTPPPLPDFKTFLQPCSLCGPGKGGMLIVFPFLSMKFQFMKEKLLTYPRMDTGGNLTRPLPLSTAL